MRHTGEVFAFGDANSPKRGCLRPWWRKDSRLEDGLWCATSFESASCCIRNSPQQGPSNIDNAFCEIKSERHGASGMEGDRIRATVTAGFSLSTRHVHGRLPSISGAGWCTRGTVSLSATSFPAIASCQLQLCRATNKVRRQPSASQTSGLNMLGENKRCSPSFMYFLAFEIQFSSNTSRYVARFLFPLMIRNAPVPFTETQPHITTLPAPCFTVGNGVLGIIDITLPPPNMMNGFNIRTLKLLSGCILIQKSAELFCVRCRSGDRYSADYLLFSV